MIGFKIQFINLRNDLPTTILKILVISRYTNLVRHRSEAEIFIGLAKSGIDITIMTVSDSPFNNLFSIAGIKVISHHPEKRFSVRSILKIRKELRKSQYQVVHLFNSKAIPAGIIASLGLNVKIVVYRGAKGPYWHDISAYIGHFHPRVSAVICLSEYVKESILKQKVIDPKKLHVITKGIDPSWFEGVTPFFYEFQKLNSKAKIITCVAHLRPVKGVDYLIEAAGILANHKDLHFVFVGKGTNQETFRKKLSLMPNFNRLHGFGEVDDVRPHILACNIYVQPSISEGLAKSVIEAMVYSKPIIITKSGGPEEIIQNDVSGKVVPIRNAKALAKSILELLNNDIDQKRFGRAAKKNLLKNLTIEATIAKTLKVYQTILSV